jgi:hypothetical protein
MGGFAIGSAFDSKSGQMIMAALLLMFVSFYAGYLFGNNAPLYISHLPNTLSTSNGNITSLLQTLLFFFFAHYYNFISVPL